MINPASFDTAWTEAEAAAFNYLCTATSCEPNIGAFIGRSFNIANGFWFTTSPMSGAGSQIFLQCVDFPTMTTPAYAIFTYQSRPVIQEVVMKVIRSLPIRDDANSNMHLFRITNVGEISPEFKPVPKSPQQILLWTVRIDFDLTFITGGKANAI